MYAAKHFSDFFMCVIVQSWGLRNENFHLFLIQKEDFIYITRKKIEFQKSEGITANSVEVLMIKYEENWRK